MHSQPPQLDLARAWLGPGSIIKHWRAPVGAGFMTDLSREPCWKREVVKFWVFGHTHFNRDFRDVETDTRVVSNQRGYYFSQAEGFDIAKVVEV